MARPSAKRIAAEAAAHLRRSETWNGLRAGDAVLVEGVKIRGGTWEFRAHIFNERNGSESIEVIGGNKGERTVRSFAPDRIYAKTGRRSKSGSSVTSTAGQLSLAEAPQLPLG